VAGAVQWLAASPRNNWLLCLAIWGLCGLGWVAWSLHHIGWRYLALKGARLFGPAWRWLTTEWRLPLVLIGLLYMGLVGIEIVSQFDKIDPHSKSVSGIFHILHTGIYIPIDQSKPEKLPTLSQGSRPMEVLGIFVLSWLFWWAWQARRRMIIEEFVDFTSKEAQPTTKGLATLLADHLSRARDLYRTVDEQRAVIAVGVESISIRDANIKTEDVTDILKNAVSGNAKFNVGFLEVPVGLLMTLFARLVQGPRILCGLHKEGEQYILTAQLVGDRRPLSWRVEDTVPLAEAPPGKPRRLDDLVAELACRIFTDLALPNSVRWRATERFNEGLRIYRDCLRTPLKRKLKLRQAEKAFLRTLEEDERFYWAYYNLGLVYTGLGQTKAAEVAFREAIHSQEHRRWEPYYALAQVRFDADEREGNEPAGVLREREVKSQDMAIAGLCERVIALKWRTARGYRIRGRAERKEWEHSNSEANQRTEGYLARAKESGEHAVANSWLELCNEYWRRRSLEPENNRIPQRTSITRDCLHDLAITCLLLARYPRRGRDGRWNAPLTRRAERLLRQARYLTPSDSELCFEIARIHHARGRQAAHRGKRWRRHYELALQEYQAAMQISAMPARHWAYLWLLHTELAALRDHQAQPRPLWGHGMLQGSSPAQEQEEAARVWDKFLDRVQTTPRAVLDEIVRDFLEFQDEYPTSWTQERTALDERARQIRLWGDRMRLVARLRREVAQGRAGMETLEQEFRDHKEALPPDLGLDAAWEYSQRALALAQLYSEMSKDAEANVLLCETINRLEPLYRTLPEQPSPEDVWTAGQLALALGHLKLQLASLRSGVFQKTPPETRPAKPMAGLTSASDNLRRAREMMEGRYPLLTRRLEARTLLARALLQEKKVDEALMQAEQAVWRDPLSGYERLILGKVYESFDELEQARHLWEVALTREPDEPTYHLYVAGAYRRLGLESRSGPEREEALTRAKEYYQNALELYENGQCWLRGQAHYNLGEVCREQSLFEDALPHFRMAHALGFAPQTSIFQEGWACLNARRYDESVQKFQSVVNSLNLAEAGGAATSTQVIEPEVERSLSRGEMLLQAHLGLAFAYAERDVVQPAEASLEAAKTIWQRLSADEKQHVNMHLADCEGWILYKRSNGDLSAAIRRLQEAVTFSAHPDAYYHLAVVYTRQAQTDAGRAQEWLRQALDCCRYVRDMDTRQQFTARVEALEKRLHEQEAAFCMPAPSPGANGVSPAAVTS
jgi:tetratricopeptide (TPR) repeat protein